MSLPKYPEGHNLLSGKKVVITAAAGSGIGFATAKRCLEEGAAVLISDHHPRRLDEAAEKLAAFGSVGALVCDVTKEADIQALVGRAEDDFGAIDVWINNAGLGGTDSVATMSDASWHAVLDVTLTGTFRCMRAVLNHMQPRGAGVIVNNASVLGWRAQKGQAHYAAAKAGVMALTRCAALEAAEYDVRINGVAPSLAMHPFLAKVTSEELLAELTAKEAFGRPAEVWEIANVIVFLASDLSSYMTGETISVSSQRA
jgi:3-oxoacyl-[acyl-carrier protein] reductase